MMSIEIETFTADSKDLVFKKFKIKDLEYNETRITFVANSYLYNQIRLMVGQLYLVGIGKLKVEGEFFIKKIEMKEILDQKINNLKFIAPPYGLYLIDILDKTKEEYENDSINY
jgi:tRNA U38,U39,U40 pseudouridine synthase TruA